MKSVIQKRFLLSGAALFCLACSNAAAAGDWTVEVKGAHRVLYEYLDNQFRQGRAGEEDIFNFRTGLTVTAQNGGLSAVVEIEDSRIYGLDDVRNVTPGQVNAVEPLQYYLSYEFDASSVFGAKAGVRAGRFTWPMGSGRIIGRNGYRNTRFSFMGARAHLQTDNGNRLEAFWMMPAEIRPNDTPSLDDNEIDHDRFSDDLTLAGVFAESKTLIDGVTSRGYAVWLDEEDDGATGRQSRDRNLFTIGAQFQKSRSEGSWDFDIEGALQSGERRETSNPLDVTDLDVGAGFLHAEVGYSFAGSGLNLAVTYDFASGDDDPSDGESGLFDPIFGPIRGDLGPTGLFTLVHRNNINAPGARLLYRSENSWDLMLHWQAVWLDSATDSFGRIGVRDITGNSGTFTGHQIQGRFRMPVFDGKARFEVGAVSFQNGEFFDNAPNATGNGNPFFLYSAIEFFF